MTQGTASDVACPAETPGFRASGPRVSEASVLFRGFMVQFQVIHALILRETRTRFGAQRLGYLWAVLEPTLWIGTFWGMFTVVHRHIPHDLEPLGFLTTGILGYELFNNNVTRIGDAINGNKGLLFYPQVHPIDLVWARAALECATMGVVFVVITAGGALLRQEVPVIDDPLRLAAGFGLSALLGTSLGLVLCMASVVFRVVERLRGPLMRPLFWLSGLFFTIDEVPPDAQPLLLLNPVLHCVEMVRDGWFVEYESPAASPRYVLWYVLALMTLGLVLERVVRKRIDLS